MNGAAAPIIQTHKAELVVSEGVALRVSLLEATTGRVLPEDAIRRLPELTLDKVNEFFFNHAVKDESVEGWNKVKLRLKRESSPVSQYTIDYAHRNMINQASRLREYTQTYAKLLASYRKWLNGTLDVTDASALEPAVAAGYVVREISPAKVVLSTPTIILQHNGYKYDMGKYKVVIEEGVMRVVQWSGGYGGNGYRHPHITRDGSVCWGTAHGAYVDFLETGNPNEALLALLSVLRSYNSNSPYKGIAYWVPSIIGDNLSLPVENSYIAGVSHYQLEEGEDNPWINPEYEDAGRYARYFTLCSKETNENAGRFGLQKNQEGKLTWVRFERDGE